VNDIRELKEKSKPLVDWASVAHWLLAETPDAAINNILRELGRKHGVDRAWVIRYNPELTHFWNTHEWVRPGVESFVKELQGIPISMAGYLNEFLSQGLPASIPDTAKIPRNAKALRSEFRRQKIQSILCVPIFWQEKLIIQIGVDSVSTTREWSEAEILSVKTAGDLIALKLFRNEERSASHFPPNDPAEPLIHFTHYGGTFAVPKDDIIMISSQGNYTLVHLRDGRQILELKSLLLWEKQLPKEHFVRIYRGTLINVSEIERLDRRRGEWNVWLRNRPDPLIVGRVYRPILRHHLGL